VAASSVKERAIRGQSGPKLRKAIEYAGDMACAIEEVGQAHVLVRRMCARAWIADTRRNYCDAKGPCERIDGTAAALQRHKHRRFAVDFLTCASGEIDQRVRATGL
jgi:hypothetical protein